MEVILDQQNLSSLDFVSSPSQTGQRASEGDCSLHWLSLQLSVSLYLLPTSDRLSSNSTSTVAKSTDANSRSAARQSGRVNASLLYLVCDRNLQMHVLRFGLWGRFRTNDLGWGHRGRVEVEPWRLFMASSICSQIL